jgi:hypothetical protein
MKKELSWQFIAADKQEKDGRFMEATIITVNAVDEKGALKKAKSVIKRKIFFLKSVAEIDNRMDKIIDNMKTL